MCKGRQWFFLAFNLVFLLFNNLVHVRQGAQRVSNNPISRTKAKFYLHCFGFFILLPPLEFSYTVLL